MKRWEVWRPVGEPELQRVQAALQGAARAWSEAWLGSVGSGPALENTRAPVLEGSAREGKREPALLNQQRWRYGDAIELSLTPTAARACAMSALRHDGLAFSAGQSGTDVAVIEAFQQRMLDDLAQRIAALLQLPQADAGLRAADAAPRFVRAVHAELGVADRAIYLGVTIDLAALGTSPRVPKTSALPPVCARKEAVAASRTEIAAKLRNVSISAAELLALKVGDVVITSHSLDEPLDIQVAASGVLPGQAFPCRQQDRLVMQFSVNPA